MDGLRGVWIGIAAGELLTLYAELHKKGGSDVDHIGLRMVMSMVDEAVYINSLGLNNLTLEITA